ncbi:MAG: hypothetical protein WDA00_03725 [Eubacteriales bacterium]
MRANKGRGLLALGLLVWLLSVRVSAQAPSLEASSEAPPSATGSPEAEDTDWLAEFRAALPDLVADRVEVRTPEDAMALVGFEHLSHVLWQGLRDATPRILSTFATLCGLAVLGGAVTLLSDGLQKGELRQALATLTGVASALAIYALVADTVTRTTAYLADLRDFAVALLPVMSGLYVAGGNTATAVANSAATSGMLLLMEGLGAGVLSPLVSACFAFALVGALGGGVKLDGVAKNLRGIYLTLLGLMAAVATASLGLQTALAQATDSVGIRTARFAVGSMIPLVGTALGSTLSTLSASLTLIKSTVGVGAVAAVVLLTLPIVIELYGTRLCLSLCASLAKMLGFESGERLLTDFRGIFDMALAVVAFTSVMFIMYLTIFIKCAYAIS